MKEKASSQRLAREVKNILITEPLFNGYRLYVFSSEQQFLFRAQRDRATDRRYLLGYLQCLIKRSIDRNIVVTSKCLQSIKSVLVSQFCWLIWDRILKTIKQKNKISSRILLFSFRTILFGPLGRQKQNYPCFLLVQIKFNKKTIIFLSP